MKLSAVLAFVAVGTVAVACNSGDDGDTGGTTTTGGGTAVQTSDGTTGPNVTGQQTQTTPEQNRSHVGSVLAVVSPGGTVDGLTAEEETEILQAAVLETEPEGKIHFRVDGKIDECILRAQARAVVEPGDGRAVDLQLGGASCVAMPLSQGFSLTAGDESIQIPASGEMPTAFQLVVSDAGLQSLIVGQGIAMLRGEAVTGGELARVTRGGEVVRDVMGGFDRDLAGLIGATQAPVEEDPSPTTADPGSSIPEEVETTPQPALDE